MKASSKPRGSSGETIRFGEFELDLRRRELRKRGIRIRVQEQPLTILTALLEQPGEVLSREELRKRVWGEETFVEFEHGLNAAVNRLREALCDSAESPRYVETVARRGYRFIAEVEGAKPQEQEEEVPKPPIRSRWATWGIAASILAAIVGLGIWSLTRDVRPEPLAVVPLTTDLGNEYMPSFSPDGKQVAYTWSGENTENFDVYVKVVGSAGKPLRLTSDPAEDLNPVWSPDGSQIAFVRQMGGQASVCLISPLGGGERKLFDFQPSAFPVLAWAPNGKVLALSVKRPQGDNGIFAFDIESGKEWRLTSSRLNLGDRSPAFSADGRFLAYTSADGLYSSDVFLISLGTDLRPQGEPRRLTHQGYSMRGLTWAADGQSLIYAASQSAAVSFKLWRVSVSGTDPPELLPAAGTGVTFPTVSVAGSRLAFTSGHADQDLMKWRAGETASAFASSTMTENQPRFSPDGSRIVFSSNRSGEGHAIWSCAQDGSNLVQLTNKFSRYQGSPSWSPDGRFVVFDAQGTDGHWDIYRVPSSGGKEQRLTASGSDNSSPVYSRDGRCIYMSSTRTGKSEIWRMPANGGEAVQITRGGGYYAAESWDGKTLYFNNAGGTLSAITPLMAKSLTDGSERQILDAVYARRFVAVKEGIYYLGPALEDGQYPLSFLDFATGRKKLITKFTGSPGLGLTVSPDGKNFLFTLLKLYSFDLMMIDNFR